MLCSHYNSLHAICDLWDPRRYSVDLYPQPVYLPLATESRHKGNEGTITRMGYRPDGIQRRVWDGYARRDRCRYGGMSACYNAVFRFRKMSGHPALPRIMDTPFYLPRDRSRALLFPFMLFSGTHAATRPVTLPMDAVRWVHWFYSSRSSATWMIYQHGRHEASQLASSRLKSRDPLATRSQSATPSENVPGSPLVHAIMRPACSLRRTLLPPNH